VCVAITDQQSRLEEDEAGVPDGGDTTQEWQEHLANHGLNHEEQTGAEDDGDEKERSHARASTDYDAYISSRQPVVNTFP